MQHSQFYPPPDFCIVLFFQSNMDWCHGCQPYPLHTELCKKSLILYIQLSGDKAGLLNTSIFTRLTLGKLKEFCRSHADLSYSFSVYYSELRS